MICPDCKGEKEIKVFPKITENGKIICTLPCYRCEESGEVPDIQKTWIHLGSSIRADRISRGNTLREEAKMLGIDAIALSNAERGITDPTRLSIPDDENGE